MTGLGPLLNMPPWHAHTGPLASGHWQQMLYKHTQQRRQTLLAHCALRHSNLSKQCLGPLLCVHRRQRGGSAGTRLGK